MCRLSVSLTFNWHGFSPLYRLKEEKKKKKTEFRFDSSGSWKAFCALVAQSCWNRKGFYALLPQSLKHSIVKNVLVRWNHRDCPSLEIRGRDQTLKNIPIPLPVLKKVSQLAQCSRVGNILPTSTKPRPASLAAKRGSVLHSPASVCSAAPSGVCRQTSWCEAYMLLHHGNQFHEAPTASRNAFCFVFFCAHIKGSGDLELFMESVGRWWL